MRNLNVARLGGRGTGKGKVPSYVDVALPALYEKLQTSFSALHLKPHKIRALNFAYVFLSIKLA
jgi:hypothetical protein